MGFFASNRVRRRSVALLAAACAVGDGCSRITAVNLNDPKQPEGIPYYLPKPYLIVSKNVRYIPTPTVGLTSVVTAPPAEQPKDPAVAGGSKKNDASTADPKTGKGGDGGDKGGDDGGGGNGDQKGGNANAGGASRQMALSRSDDPLRDPGVRRYADALAVQLVAELDDPPAPGGGNTAPRRDATSIASGGNRTTESAPNAPGQETPATDRPPAKDSPSDTATQFFGPAALNVVPYVPMPDGLQPETFYTYQFVYLPDLTQKYGLRIEGGAGEMRQTMNLVNGWMYTGAGPMYLRNSSTADNINATGQAVGAIGDALAKLIIPAPTTGGETGGGKKSGDNTGQQVAGLESPAVKLNQVPDYAELYVYEPVLDAQSKAVTWHCVSAITLTRPTLVSAHGPVTSGDAGGNADVAAERDAIPDALKGRVITAGPRSSQGVYRITEVAVGDQIVVTLASLPGVTPTLTDDEIRSQLVELLKKVDPPIIRQPKDFVIKRTP